jgi:hypothetical protein
MIRVMMSLYCDGCAARYRPTVTLPDWVHKRAFNALRSNAKLAGWRRLRPRIRHVYGDYCPACTQAMKRAPGRDADLPAKPPEESP